MDNTEIRAHIKAKVIEIADQLGFDAKDLGDEDIIPATGYLDSAGILELVAWYEHFFDMPLKQEEITIDNLGSVASMAAYVERRKGG
jgi:D-alanine--poly(phosphoribitol) ligase subunit 2